MITFLSPWAFLFFILIVILIYFYIKTRKNNVSLSYPTTHNIKSYFESAIFVAKDLHFILKMFAFVFFIIALARPVTISTKSNDIGKGYYISLVLDISPSMLGEDLKPTRLGAAKRTIANFVDNRQMDKISFVTFATKANVKCPTTLDYKNLSRIISEATYDEDGGTAIGIGIATAVDTLRTMPEDSTKIIILLTDGESNSGEIDTNIASLIAASFGIKIYTIGVGDPENDSVWVTWDGRRHLMDYALNEDTLIDIASTTSGRYFNAKNTSMLKDIYETIDKLEKNEIKDDRLFEYKEHYRMFLFIGLLFLLSMFILTSTRYITIP